MASAGGFWEEGTDAENAVEVGGERIFNNHEVERHVPEDVRGPVSHVLRLPATHTVRDCNRRALSEVLLFCSCF
jgi:hypothetical protein